MLKLRISRPNTIGTTYEWEYANYAEAEEFIERRCEQLANQGWELSELPESTSLEGIIEATHDKYADTLLIEWRTINET